MNVVYVVQKRVCGEPAQKMLSAASASASAAQAEPGEQAVE